MQQRHRIFIAINLPPEVTRFLAKFQERYQEELPAKWIPKDQLHLTLIFMGDLTDQELADTCQIVAAVAKQENPFTVKLQQIAYGPEGKIPPRYVWAGGEKSKELSELKRKLQEALLEKIDFLADEKSFVPHITLARIREWQWRQINPDERPEINELVDLEIPVDSIEVMESELKRGGSVYHVIESHQLGQ